jgi:hypothetical protein
MFARSPSLDEIVDRAYELLLAAVGMRLMAALEPPFEPLPIALAR